MCPLVEKSPWILHFYLKTLCMSSLLERSSVTFCLLPIWSGNSKLTLADNRWLRANDEHTKPFDRLCLYKRRVLWIKYFLSFSSVYFLHFFSAFTYENFPLSFSPSYMPSSLSVSSPLPEWIHSVLECCGNLLAVQSLSIYPVILGSKGSLHCFLSSHRHRQGS